MNRTVIIGDQICADYCPVLAAKLRPDLELWHAPQLARTSVDLLVAVREVVLPRQPSLTVLAAGCLDARQLCFEEAERVVPLEHYARNVRCALEMLQARCAGQAVWATIPPVDERRAPHDEDFGYDNETLSLYNQEAKAVAKSLGIEVIDVYGIVKAAARDDSARPDGIHFDSRSSDYLAAQIAQRLRQIVTS